MNTLEQAKLLESINKLKLQKDFSNYPINELLKLKTFNGIAEFNFNNFPFYMLNIANDDGVVLKYLWRDEYEKSWQNKFNSACVGVFSFHSHLCWKLLLSWRKISCGFNGGSKGSI